MTDHITTAISRLSHQFRGKSRIEGLLTALAQQAQELDSAFQSLLVERQIDTAIGSQLDAIGSIVGQPRDGNSDDLYRRYVRARIMVNRSQGTTEDLIRVTSLVIHDDDALIRIMSQGIAALVVRVEEGSVAADVADVTIDMLREAVSAGVRIILESSTVPASQAFNFADGPGLGFATRAFAAMDGIGGTVNVDTVLRSHLSGVSGNQQSIAFVDDGVGAGNLEDDLVAFFHFEPGVTTVANFESAIASSVRMFVYTPGSPATMDVTDVSGQIFFGGGAAGGKFASARD